MQKKQKRDNKTPFLTKEAARAAKAWILVDAKRQNIGALSK